MKHKQKNVIYELVHTYIEWNPNEIEYIYLI